MSTIRPAKKELSYGSTASGDLGGTYPGPTVVSVQGLPFSSVVPQDGQVLTWNGSEWVAGATAATGTGGGGVLYYLNSDINPDIPITGLTAPIIKELGLSASIPQGSFTRSNLSTGGVYDEVVGFVTDLNNPSLTVIPAGIWDIIFWASDSTASASDLFIKVKVYIYDGSSITLIGTSGATTIFDPTVVKQYTCSMVIPETPVLSTDRIYLSVEATSVSSGKSITLYFGDSTPSHTRTTIPSIRGTGIVHVVDGTIQNPATAVDLASSDVTGVLQVSNGGTGLSTSPSDGQLLIGNGSGFTEATLTAGTGVSISNGSGSITVTNTGVIGVTGSAPVASSGGANPTISLNDSGVTANSYGDASSIPSFTVTSKGLISSAGSNSVSIGASQITSGTLAVARGGTGLSSTPSNGQLLIGNGTGFTESTLTAGTGVSVSNGSGSITVANTGVISVGGSAPIASSGGANPTVSLNDSGVVANSYGDAASIPSLTITSKGLVSSASSNPVSIGASQITSGTLPIARGGTGLSTTPTNGQLLIGNGTGFTESTLTAGTGVSVSNGSGSITVANTGVISVAGSSPISSSGGANPTVSLNDSGVVAGSYGTASSIPSFTVSSKGLISSAGSSSVSIDASQITSGTLPIARGGTGLSTVGAAGNILISNGTSLVSNPVTGNVTMTSGGVTTVNAVQNVPVSVTAPANGNILQYNGTSWAPSDIISTLQVSYQTVLASEAIAAGDVVYVVNSGGSGSVPTVARAQANSISTIRGVIGFAIANIAKNAQGTVQTYGQLSGPVDTHTFSQGAPIFVSTSTPGGVTDVKPEAPNFAFQVGIVTRQGQPQNVTTGIVFISPIMQADTNNLSNVITSSAALNDVLICTATAVAASGGNPALPPVMTTGQLTKLYYTNTPLSLNAGQQIVSANFDTAGSKVIYLPITSGNSTITLSSPKPIVDLTSSDYGRQLWLHNVGNANITVPRAGGGNRNVALEGGVSQTLLPGSIIKLMWINPGNGQAYWLQTEKIITST